MVQVRQQPAHERAQQRRAKTYVQRDNDASDANIKDFKLLLGTHKKPNVLLQAVGQSVSQSVKATLLD